MIKVLRENINMTYKKTKFDDVIIIEPSVYSDERGYFYESFKQSEFSENVCDTRFVLEFESKSKKNTLRGLHYQVGEFAQSKLVNVSFGKVLDIIVDIKKNSPTFGEHIMIELSSENNLQVFIPKGYAHGFLTLSDVAVMHYKLDNYYSPEHYTGLNFFNHKLNIQLPINIEDLCISSKDQELPMLDSAILF